MQTTIVARRAAALLAASLMLAGCTTAVSGTAGPVDHTAPPEMVLRQQPGSGSPSRFSGVPAYDACSVLPLDVVVKSGFSFDVGLDATNTVKSARLTENAEDDPNSHSANPAIGLSQCQYPGQHSLRLTFTIYQAPFDAPESQAARERSLRQEGAKDGEAAGFRTLSVAHTDTVRSEYTMIFAPGFSATLELLLGTGPTPLGLGARLVEQAAQRLRAAPAGPSTYSYDGEFAQVPPPCEIFQTADFTDGLGLATDGRPVEGHGLARSHTAPDGSPGQRETFEVLTSCRRETQSSANWRVGGTPAQSVDVGFTTYQTADMAVQANDHDCARGKGYRHPFGEPIEVGLVVGDGLTCVINMGHTVSPLTFISGKTKVEIGVFWVANLDDATASRVYSMVAKAVAARLAGR